MDSTTRALDVESAATVDLSTYLAHQAPIADKQAEFDGTMRLLRRFHPHPRRMLEIGIGSGWWQVLGLRAGLDCEGIELSPQLVANARILGDQYGVSPSIRPGNIETVELPREHYDVVVAMSVFEHVPQWRDCVRKVYESLVPGGLFYFCSTNKFSLISGEYPPLPLYGWLPDSWRHRIRVRRQGLEVMKFRVDFHQFTYPGLRRAFRQIGFREVFDFVDMKSPESLNHPKFRGLMTVLKRVRGLKHLFLTFYPTTVFLCRK